MVTTLLDNAVDLRASLLDEDTNALRLVDGMGDGVQGFALENYAGKWMAMTPGGEIRADIKEWLKASGRSIYWKRLDQHHKESPMHLYGEPVDGAFSIRENRLNFEVSFSSGYSQGIFLDQRLNRAEVMQRMARGRKLLNLFSYTGGFSVAAAMAGAQTTTLDLSSVYLEWAKRNFHFNGLDESEHFFCKGDAFHWLKRFAKQERIFDGIVLDPPTFSRDENGKVFRVEKDFGELVELAKQVLAKDGWMLCCTNFRGISERDFMRMINMPKMQGVKMPEDFSEDPYLKSVWVG